MAISEVLKDDIEAYAVRLRHSNTLFARAKRGELTPEVIAKYVSNLYFLVSNTEPHLRLARSRAEELGRPALANFFANKAREERGHERWAVSDLDSLRRMFGVSGPSEPAFAISELLRYLRGIIEEEPAQYLAYILFSEYLTVLVGAEWLVHVETNCGVPSEAMSVVGNHVELDKDHVRDGLDEIEALLGDETEAASLRRALQMAMRYFDGFCDEISATVH